MDIFQALILGTVQGLTEFIPVSSSGHLILAESFLGLHVEDLKAFDVVVHMGTLVAIFAYFWKDFWEFILAVWFWIVPRKTKTASEEVLMHQKWLIYIVCATIPAVIVGLVWEDLIDSIFRDPFVVAGVMVVVGVVFLAAEHALSRQKTSKITFKNAMVIGLAQACALIPGVSRSGSTISAAIAQGIPRDQAARFSFLLGAPAIFGAGLLTGIKAWKNGDFSLGFDLLAAGFVSSAVVGYLCVAFLMKFLKKHTLKVFAFYLIAIGVLAYGGLPLLKAVGIL